MAVPAAETRRLGRYEILEEIGHGGMATVYRARDSVLERDVALKVLHPHLRGAPEARARFRREAKTVARLRHPNVLEVYDFGEDDETEAYLATELLTGPTLKQFILERPRLIAEAGVAMCIALGEGLAQAHELGIVHRDVKPENVLLHEGRTLKLTDFGIAHLVDAHTVTSTGQVMGSPGHMAPEIVQGAEACVATDVFSFGTVMYFVLTGSLPFTGKNPHQLLFRILECEFVDPLRLEPSIGRQLAEIVTRCLAKDPLDRPASMKALVAELRGFLEARGFTDVDALLREAVASPRQSAERLRPLAVKAEIALGDEAVAARNTMEALGHFDRALALDPGHAEVLDRVRRVSDGGARPQLVRRVGLGLGLFGVLALGVAIYVVRRPAPTAHFQPDTLGRGGSSAMADPRPPVEPVASGSPEPTAPSPGGTSSATAVTANHPNRSHAVERTAERRVVVFRPEPQNVSISVDDGPAREFGPSFRSAELAPGPHRVRIVPGTECCEVVAFTITVAPGTTPMVVARSLPLKPARVYVMSSVPSDVSVQVAGQVVARGRAREFLRVPMTTLDATARISVTADGYGGYTGPLGIRAGEVARTSVTLEPSSP